MNNFSIKKESKSREKVSFKKRMDLNTTLTEKSCEKTLENLKINDNSASKKSFYKNIITKTNPNKTSKTSHLSEKDLINLKTQKSKSKENLQNKSIDLRFKNNNSKGVNISALFKDGFPKYLKNSLSKFCFDFSYTIKLDFYYLMQRLISSYNLNKSLFT